MLGLGTQNRSCNKKDHPEYQRMHQAPFRPALRAPRRDHFPFLSQVAHLAATIKCSFAKSRYRNTGLCGPLLGSGSVGATFRLAAKFGEGLSAGMPKAILISLTSDERRARPHIARA